MPMSHEKEQQTTVTGINPVDRAWSVGTNQARNKQQEKHEGKSVNLSCLLCEMPGSGDERDDLSHFIFLYWLA